MIALCGSGIALLTAVLLRPPEAASTLIIPRSPWPGFGYFELAHRLGIDQRHDLRIESIDFDDGQLIVQAYLDGRLSLAQVSNVEAVEICRRQPQRCPRVVLMLDASNGADRLLVRRSSLDLADLRGRRVGVTPFGLGPYVLSRALESAGLELDDVQQVHLQAHEMPRALTSGRVEAAVLYSPFSEQAMRLGISRVLFDSRQMPGELNDLLVVEPGFYEGHRPAIIRLLRVWQEAHDWARRHRRAALERMAPAQQLSVSGLEQAERGVTYADLSEQRRLLAPRGPVARSLEQVRDGLADLGRLPASSPLPLVIDQPVRQALESGHDGQASAPPQSPRRSLPK